jgi:hypothetical protein
VKGRLSAAALLLFAVASGTAQDRPGRRGEDKAPKVGDKAPDFKLKTLGDPDKEVKLSEFAGKSPVVLVFGSYT